MHDLQTSTSEFVQHFNSFRHGTSFVFCGFDCVSIAGSDRAKFFHNFCTANVKATEIGNGSEAFLLNVKGKTIGFVYMLALADELLLLSSHGTAEQMISHLDRYVIREDVTLSNKTGQLDCVLICKEATDVGLKSQSKLEGYLSSIIATISERNVTVCNSEFTSAQETLIIARNEDRDVVTSWLGDQGISPIDSSLAQQIYEVARINHGTPEFSNDITDANLPQEIQHDERAISFTKGCYLGQETVARIDALGHVNKFLVPLNFANDSSKSSQEIQVDSDLIHDGKSVGKVTSICLVSKEGKSLTEISVAGDVSNFEQVGLGYVKRGLEKVGTEFVCEGGKAIVRELKRD